HEGHSGVDRQKLEQLPERFEAAGGGSDPDHRDQVVPDLLTFGAPILRAGLGARLIGNFLPSRLCALGGLVRRRVRSHLWPAPGRWRVPFFAHSRLLVFSQSCTYDGSIMADVE